MTLSEGMQHICEFCGHDFAREPQPAHNCDPLHVLDRIKLKPRTIVKRFAFEPHECISPRWLIPFPM